MAQSIRSSLIGLIEYVSTCLKLSFAISCITISDYVNLLFALIAERYDSVEDGSNEAASYNICFMKREIACKVHGSRNLVNCAS